jgi:hypothetical protein
MLKGRTVMCAPSRLLIVVILACSVSAGGLAQSRTQDGEQKLQPRPTETIGSPTLDQTIDRIIARERDEIGTIGLYEPITETYVQVMKPDKTRDAVPMRDFYFLGKAKLSTGVVDNSMLAKKNAPPVRGSHDSRFLPEGFLTMVYLDRSGFDRQHYRFDYVSREFLGEIRCLVFDVTPLPTAGNGRFEGRMWVEDRDYTIVRFNGVYIPIHARFWPGGRYNGHFDSWRLSVQPGLWVPAYIFSQETDLKLDQFHHLRFKAQTRLWGYDLKIARHEQELSQLNVEAANAIQSQADADLKDRSPVQAQRFWRSQAETNALDALERAGLLAPPGAVDKTLGTVVNNIEVTNNLAIEPEINCRVLTTGTLEMFSVGHTIVLSRGLLDVLPDEASLATMLAQEIAATIDSKKSVDQFGFSDVVRVSSTDAMERFSFRDRRENVEAANRRALELLHKSPYKDKLGSAGLFLKQLHEESKALSALISPQLGNSVYFAAELINSAPSLQPEKLDQIAALPIGGRLKIDPWTDRAEMLKTKPVALASAREKMPFEITPFMPFLTRYETSRSANDSHELPLTGAARPEPRISP